MDDPVTIAACKYGAANLASIGEKKPDLARLEDCKRLGVKKAPGSETFVTA